MKSLSSSKLAVVYAVFAAIFPLTFTIANGKASFLIDSLINVVWCSLTLSLSVFLLIYFREAISTKKLTGLAILYLLVPFSFFSSEVPGFHFVVLKSSFLVSATMVLISLLLFWFLVKAKRSEAK